MKLRIGTRGSDLALWQAHTVAGWLREAPGVAVDIVVLKTRGDTIDDVPLSTVPGKDFFTAEIERALHEASVDIAVHSHKDLATEAPAGLVVVGVPARGPDLEQLLVRPSAWRPDAPFLPLAPGAKVGTSAPRRCEQLLALRPDLVVESLRGNVPTRVGRLREGRYDAIVLAAAGLERLALELDPLEVVTLDRRYFVPAPAQGALAIQVRSGDTQLAALIAERMHDPATARAIEAERRVLAAAGGGCSLPLGANLVADQAGGYRMHAFLGADHPTGAAARWVDVQASTPEEAAERALAALVGAAPTGVGPLAGARIAVAGAGDESGLVRRLRTLGATVAVERVIEFEPLPAPELGARVAALAQGDAIAVTSPRAAASLAGLELPVGVTLAAVGPTTADALEARGLAVGVVGSGGARELAAELPAEPGATVLWPAAREPRPDLARGLEARGVQVERLAVYATHPIEDATGEAAVDVRIYTSPSAVRALLAWERSAASQEPKGAPRAVEDATRLALGRSTWEALREHGLEPGPMRDLSDSTGPEALLPRLLAALGRDGRVWCPRRDGGPQSLGAGSGSPGSGLH